MAIKSIEITNLTNNQLYGFRMFPRNLKGQYQTRDDKGTATATPKAIPPIFGEATWEQINLASTTNAIPSTWHVGDTKDITLTTGETLTMQIYGFNHDDLADGSDKKAGITLGMKNLMKNQQFLNSLNDDVFFTNSELFIWLQGELYNSLPIELKSYIKSINKKTARSNATISTNSMKIFLFSEVEVFGQTILSTAGEGTQYTYFQTPTNRIKKLSNGTGEIDLWWERSMHITVYYYCKVNKDGSAGQSLPRNLSGVCFGFCI